MQCTEFDMSHNSSHFRTNSINFSPIFEDKNRHHSLQANARSVVETEDCSHYGNRADTERSVPVPSRRPFSLGNGDVPVSGTTPFNYTWENSVNRPLFYCKQEAHPVTTLYFIVHKNYLVKYKVYQLIVTYINLGLLHNVGPQVQGVHTYTCTKKWISDVSACLTCPWSSLFYYDLCM